MDSSFDRDLKSRSSGREASSHAGDEEEKEDISDQDDDSTPPTFWRASANAVEATDLAEPATFQDVISGPDQVHWRKTIRAELESMRLPGVFVLPSYRATNAISGPSGCSRLSSKRVDRSRSSRRVSLRRASSRNMASTTPKHSPRWSST